MPFDRTTFAAMTVEEGTYMKQRILDLEAENQRLSGDNTILRVELALLRRVSNQNSIHGNDAILLPRRIETVYSGSIEEGDDLPF